jgi:hypothetical protein
MVGGVVGLQCVALVGFVVGMGVGTLGVGSCWDLLQVCCIYCLVGAIKGDTGLAWPEQRICGVTVGCGGCMGAICDASTILHVVGSGWSCVRAGAWLLVVLVISSEELSVGAWLVGLSGYSSANGANGLLLRVTL